MLAQLKNTKKVVGIKQTKKAIREGLAQKVYIASDAEIRITRPIAELCAEHQVPIELVDTMQALGASAGIDIGASVVATLHIC